MTTAGGGRVWRRRLAALAAVLAALAALAALAYGGWRLVRDTLEPPDRQRIEQAAERVQAAVPRDELDAVRGAVARAHQQLNADLGYGAIGSLDHGNFRRQTAGPIAGQLREVAIRVDDPAISRDLETVATLLQIGAERGDPEALQLAHRVVHDLDHFAFNPDPGQREYWGATVTLEGGDNPAQRYVAQHR
ncbi:MAG: hypothetical protein KY462_00920 [Actinobacteria bacterium]|nr:hypothetical protein [Actinomycetota bacterium]